MAHLRETAEPVSARGGSKGAVGSTRDYFTDTCSGPRRQSISRVGLR